MGIVFMLLAIAVTCLLGRVVERLAFLGSATMSWEQVSMLPGPKIGPVFILLALAVTCLLGRVVDRLASLGSATVSWEQVSGGAQVESLLACGSYRPARTAGHHHILACASMDRMQPVVETSACIGGTGFRQTHSDTFPAAAGRGDDDDAAAAARL